MVGSVMILRRLASTLLHALERLVERQPENQLPPALGAGVGPIYMVKRDFELGPRPGHMSAGPTTVIAQRDDGPLQDLQSPLEVQRHRADFCYERRFLYSLLFKRRT